MGLRPIPLAQSSSLSSTAPVEPLRPVPLTQGQNYASPFGFDKVVNFGVSALESFPEMFGIEPSQRTQAFRITNPVSGFLSQIVGTLVPYVGEAKALRLIPAVNDALTGLRTANAARPALGAALELGAEAGLVGAANTAIAATPLPGALESAVTGTPHQRTEPLTNIALSNVFNTAAAGVLGGAGGLIAKRFALGTKLTDLVAGFNPEDPTLVQIRALNEAIAAHNDPVNPIDYNDMQAARIARARNSLMQFNLQGKVPEYTTTLDPTWGITGKGKYVHEAPGNIFRSVVGEGKAKGGNEIAKFLTAAMKPGARTDGLTTSHVLYFDPLDHGSFRTQADLLETANRIGLTPEVLGSEIQDARVIKVNEGTGRRPAPVSPPVELQFDLGDLATPPPAEVGPVTVARASDFRESGEYTVTLGSQSARMYRNTASGGDSITGWWYRADGNGEFLGATKAEATAKLQELLGNAERTAALRRPKPPPPAPGKRLHTNQPEWNKSTSYDQALNKAKTLQRKFTQKAWIDVGDGFAIAEERGVQGQRTGMYIIRKKIVGDIKAPAAGDAWFFGRTDRPDLVAPRAARSSERVMNSAYYPTVAERLDVGEPLMDAGSAFAKDFGGDALLNPRRLRRGPLAAMVRDSLHGAGAKLAPSAPLFERHPIANYAWSGIVKGLEALAEGRISRLMNGGWEGVANSSLFRNLLALNPKHAEGFNAGIRSLSTSDLFDVKTHLELSTPHKELTTLHAQGHVEPGAYNFLTAMQMLSDDFVARHGAVGKALVNNDAQKMLGDFTERQGHYMLTRDFPGAYKILLHDENNQVVGMASEENPLGARQAAEKIIAEQGKLGRQITAGGMFDETQITPEILHQLRVGIGRPGFLRSRGGLAGKDIIGYELQRGELTHKGLMDLVEKNVRRRENYLRDIAIQEHTAEPIAQLFKADPSTAQALKAAILRMQGNEGAFGTFQNHAMDTILHAVGLSGKDSATAIIKTTQKLMSMFQFTFGSLVQPVQNAVGQLQTMMPEMAFLMHGDANVLARNYVSLGFLANGNVSGALHMLSEVKLFKNGMDRFTMKWGDQPPEFQRLITDMMDERIINSRFVEEQYGVDGYILTNMREAFKQGHSIVDVMSAANQLMMSKGEELNRSMAVNIAYEIGSALNLPYPRMKLFVQEFVRKTSYNYATHDRAAVWTTPLGSLAGTFKNWMFHYMGSMIKYSTAGASGMRPLLWQTATTGLFGGAAATPLLIPMANAASQWMSNKSAMQNLYDTTQNFGLPERLADGIMYGLPGALGLSLSSQVQSPGADPSRDATMLFSFAAWDRMKALSSGTQAALLAYKVSGTNPFEDTNVRDELVRALAPRTLYRAMQLRQNGAIASMSTGYDIQRGGLTSGLLYAAGFNPTELEKTYEAYNAIKNDQAAQRQMVQQFGESLAQAWHEGDDRLASRVFVRAMAAGIDTSSVLRSAQSRTQRMSQTQLEFTAAPEDRAAYGFEFNDPNAQ